MGEDTANASVDPPELVMNSFQFSVLFICGWFYLHVCLFDCSDYVYRFLIIYLFLTIVCLTFTQTLRLQALSIRLKKIQFRVLISRCRFNFRVLIKYSIAFPSIPREL